MYLFSRVRQRGKEVACGRIQGTSVTTNEWKKKQLCSQHHKHIQSQGNSGREMLVFGGV